MKTTLVIDGNWLLLSRVFGLVDYFKKTNPQEVKEEAKSKLKDILNSSISINLNRFKNTINNIVLISDGGSWRKQIDRPSMVKNFEYKGNRDFDGETDWDMIFGTLTDVCDRFSSLGITTTNHCYVEGDDWAWYWSRYLNSKGINVIIWSSDNDLKQLLQVDNGVFTGWYIDSKTESNGLYLPEVLKEKSVDDIDFFLNPDISNPTLERIKVQAKNVHYINPDLIVMEKIICGDYGDNIKSIMLKELNGKYYGIGQKDWEKVRGSLSLEKLEDFFNKKEDIIRELLKINKFSYFRDKVDQVRDMFDFNTKLVWLNERVIPESIQESMSSAEYKEYDLNNIYNNYKILSGENQSDIESIFEGVLK